MILVTGGSGFIGAALVKALVGRGEEVKSFDNLFRGKASRLEDVDCDEYHGDIRDPDALLRASDGCDEIIHLAYINGTQNFYTMPAEVLDVGVRGMLNVIDVCHVRGIKKLLLASSSEVYQTAAQVPTPETVPLSIPDPYNARYSYAAGKIISEMLAIHNVGMFDNLIIVRPHNIYGPDMGNEHVIPQMAQRIKETGELIFQGQEPPETLNSTGERVFWGAAQTRAFCYITDAINGFMVARGSGLNGQVFNVGTQYEVAILDLARMIAKIAGCKLTVKSMDGIVGEGGTLRRCPDITKLASFGYKPTVPLDVGLRNTLAWYLR